MESARQLGDDRLLIDALGILADVCKAAGDIPAGSALARESLERARRLGDDALLPDAVMTYLYCRDHSDPARFEDLLAEAFACTQRTGDPIVAGFLHTFAARHYAATGNIPKARAHHDEATRLMQTLGGEQPTFMTTNLGLLLRVEGDPNGARHYLEAGLRLSRRDGDHIGAAYAILGLACVASDQAEWVRAAQLHGVAHSLLTGKGWEWNDAGVRFREESLARIRAHIGDGRAERAQVRGAELSFDEAVALALAPGLAAE